MEPEHWRWVFMCEGCAAVCLRREPEERLIWLRLSREWVTEDSADRDNETEPRAELEITGEEQRSRKDLVKKACVACRFFFFSP